ncbi:MAG: hypothetical protein NWQ24_07120 [Haliea sp.]|jgi:hypothetical protein|nr:hypothetical protein [Haliea sp.]
MMEKMIDFANVKAGDNPILFAGDFNCSIANPANGVDADFAGNCRLWIDDGFASIKKGWTHASRLFILLRHQAIADHMRPHIDIFPVITSQT